MVRLQQMPGILALVSVVYHLLLQYQLEQVCPSTALCSRGTYWRVPLSLTWLNLV